MSREIRCRVYSKRLKVYIYYYTIGFSKSGELQYISDKHGAGPIFAGDYIVEQSTLLKDKNGKEIYEGDIVKIWNDKHSGDALGGGYAIEGHWYPMVREVKMDTRGVYAEYPGYMLLRNFANIEVIGNIHENPELLEN